MSQGKEVRTAMVFKRLLGALGRRLRPRRPRTRRPPRLLVLRAHSRFNVAAREDCPSALKAIVVRAGTDDRYNDDVHATGGAREWG